jgi:molecular chaperone HscB
MSSPATKIGSPDFFSFIGLARKLNVDVTDLERRYRALSRQFHPDYFYNAAPADRRASLDQSSYLNDAYRTLKNPSTRVEYLLGLEGFAPKKMDQAAQMPPALLEEFFALNEALEDVRRLKASGAPREEWQRRLDGAREPIESKRVEHERGVQELSARWDALVDGAPSETRREVLEALRDRVLERKYIENLLAGIERELEAK